MSGTPLLDIGDLTVDYATPNGPLRAVNDVSLRVDQGETLALVGESGSGKSTIAAAIVDLLRNEAATITGRLVFKGRDIAAAGAEERRALQRQAHRHRVPGPVHLPEPEPDDRPCRSRNLSSSICGCHRGEAMQRAISSLGDVGLPDPASLVRAYPHQLSGGMQQRVLIATALVCNPELLILDEPTTALDVTVEAQILDLLDSLRSRRRLGMIYITHNLGVVSRIADRVCVLYAGQVLETGGKSQILGRPVHPYTKGLLASLPSPRSHRSRGQAVGHCGAISRSHQAGAGLRVRRPLPFCRGALPDRAPGDRRGRWPPPALLEGLGAGGHALARHQAGRERHATIGPYQGRLRSRAPKA